MPFGIPSKVLCFGIVLYNAIFFYIFVTCGGEQNNSKLLHTKETFAVAETKN